MKLFTLQKELTSYKYPSIKITACIGVLLLMFFRGRLIPVSSALADGILTVLVVLLLGPVLVILEISLTELAYVYKNRNPSKKPKRRTVKALPAEEVIRWIRENDIIEIEIVSGGKTVKIGASAECDPGSSRFYNKRLYVQNQEFESEEPFLQGLQPYAENGFLSVCAVDGVDMGRIRLK